MVDLHFADAKARSQYLCSKCKPTMRQARHCDDDGFDNLKLRKKKPIRIDAHSLTYDFCPGKATWYPEIVTLFMTCRISMTTGIMPSEGGLNKQAAVFPDVLYSFIDRWHARIYAMIWADVGDFTAKVLQAVMGKRSGGGQGGRNQPREG